MWAVVAATVASLPSPARADTVINSVTASTPAAFEADAGTTSVTYRVNANATDGEDGCNATTASPMTLDVSTPTGLTATPLSVTFTGCGVNNKKTITYSATQPGLYSLPVSAFSAVDDGIGTYDLSGVAHNVFAYDLESYRPGTEGDPATSCTSSDPAVQPIDVFDAPLCVRVYAVPNSFSSVIFDLVPPAGSTESTRAGTSRRLTGRSRSRRAL